MPQFDPSVFLSQLFWLSLCFGALFFLLYKKGIPQIAAIFSHRSDQINGQHQAAAQIKEEALKTSQEVEAQLEKARQDANEMINVAIHEMNLTNRRRKSEFMDIQKRRIKASEKNIARKKQTAYEEVKTIASETASAMIDVLAPVKTDSAKTGAILDDLLHDSQAFSTNENVKVSNAS